MTAFVNTISSAFGITLLHSLWQGMVVYVLLRMLFAALPSLSSVQKYRLSGIAMISVFLWFAGTFISEIGAFSPIKAAFYYADQGATNFAHRTAFNPSLYQALLTYTPYLCILYAIGLVLNGFKLGWEWTKIKRLKKSLLAAEQMQQFINSFSKKLDIAKKIQLKFSELVDVPCVIGFIKPIIILPVSLSVHLSACEVESILLHELSHIKRNDYIANLLQQAVSVILFFNPFIYFINKLINQERENSCDDLVIEKTGKPLIYAKALLKLEQSRSNDLQLALAVTGRKFYLLNRIERIMKTQKQIGNIRHLFAGAILLAGCICCLAWVDPTSAKSASRAAAKTKTAIVANDSTYANSDTAKKTHKAVKSKIAHTRVHHHINTTGADSTWTNSYFQSPEWKAQMEAIRKQGEEMKKQFDSPEWKAQMLAMQKQGEEMTKQFNSAEWKKQMDDMKQQFNSPEWKKQMDDMKQQFNSPEWKKQMLAMQKQGEEMAKQFNSTEWKKQMDNIKKQSEEMRKQFDSPEWRKQMEDMKKQFNSPDWKKQMEDMKKLGEEMQKEFNSTGWKKQGTYGHRWILKDSTDGVGIYKPADKDTIK